MRKKTRRPVEFHIFCAILAILDAKKQDVRDRYFHAFKHNFPIEFRMVESCLLDNRLTEFPDGEMDLHHAAEEADEAWCTAERTCDRHLAKAMAYIGETVNLDDEKEEKDEDEERWDPDIFGDMPN